ncbi:porin [Alcaligenes faecalis]|uniref:porin n=1 Tax=Alcaligenes faecalis TaxID=511 RepID=UPI000AC2BC05|nr:porin [Alcaligenes faecalis]
MKTIQAMVLLAGGLLAGTACAQSSSLTIFGHLDMNITTASAGGKSQTRMDQGGYMLPSRLGLRGTEALGDGWSVGFWLEAPVLPNTGEPQGLGWRRRSTISLVHRQLGEIRLGRDYTAAFWNVSAFAPFGTVGVGGSSNIILGWPQGLGEASTLSRASNMISYFLPKNLGGVYGQFNYAYDNGSKGTGYAGGRLGYEDGPLNVAGAYGRTSMGGYGYETATLGASYDFKTVKLYANYLWHKLGADKQEVALFGVMVPVGKGQLKMSAASSWQSGSNNGDDAQQYAIGYVHPLSKRTTLYSAYGYIRNQGQASFVTSDVSPEGQAGRKSSGLQFGISHSF